MLAICTLVACFILLLLLRLRRTREPEFTDWSITIGRLILLLTVSSRPRVLILQVAIDLERKLKI